MSKQTFFSKNSVMTTLKAIAVGIVVSLITMIPLGIGMWLKNTAVVISWLMYVVAFVIYLFAWGWIANKFWNWK